MRCLEVFRSLYLGFSFRSISGRGKVLDARKGYSRAAMPLRWMNLVMARRQKPGVSPALNEGV